MTNALLTTTNGRTHAVPTTTLRITTHMGAGTVRYLTDDGYVGVHLDGEPERRVDEVALEHLTPAARAQLEAA